MVVRRGLVLLLIEQLFEGSFLFGTAAQNQQHAVHGQACRSDAAIVLRARHEIRIALQDRELRLVNGLSDARCRRAGLRE